jgi:methionine synthase I (cobalamin-dependent)
MMTAMITLVLTVSGKTVGEDMANLKQRLASGELLILDGAIGTELQRLGVPMHEKAWCAVALRDHTDTVRQLHEDYIRAGADVITVNTFSSARYVLELARPGPAGPRAEHPGGRSRG